MILTFETDLPLMQLSDIKYVVPNSITLFALTLGMTSIYASILGRFEVSCWIIVWAALFDKADGIAARFLNASSNIGLHLDSFADFISFVIAPIFYMRAILLRHDFVAAAPRCFNNRGPSSFPTSEWIPLGGCTQHYLSVVFSLIYVYGGAIRLARFNSIEQKELEIKAVNQALNKSETVNHGHQVLTGFATTQCGIVLSLITLTALKYEHIPFFNQLLFPLPFSLILGFFGIMMNSSIRYTKPGTGQIFYKIYVVVFSLIAIPLIALQIMPEISCAIGIVTSIIVPFFTPSKEDLESISKKKSL